MAVTRIYITIQQRDALFGERASLLSVRDLPQEFLARLELDPIDGGLGPAVTD